MLLEASLSCNHPFLKQLNPKNYQTTHQKFDFDLQPIYFHYARAIRIRLSSLLRLALIALIILPSVVGFLPSMRDTVTRKIRFFLAINKDNSDRILQVKSRLDFCVKFRYREGRQVNWMPSELRGSTEQCSER